MKTAYKSVILAFSVLFSLACSQEDRTKTPNPAFDAEKFNNCGYGLLFFFTTHSCQPCMDVTEKLNELADGVPIIGVLDHRDETDLKAHQGRYAFPVELMKKEYDRYRPICSPGLVAVDRQGRIIMILPGLPDQDDYISPLLWELSAKALSL